jgi:F0F1-type ATP synthase assembly protein I
MTKKAKKEKNNHIRNFARYSGLAFEMLGIIVFGSYIGYRLDENREAEFPLWTIVFSLFAIFSSLYMVIRQLFNNK